jgi:hypothetical protein
MDPETADVEETDNSSKQDNSGPMRFLALFFMCFLGFGE